MNNIPYFSLPEQKNFEQAYGLSLRLAVEKLSKIDNLELISRKCGAIYQPRDSGSVIRLKFLNRVYQISFPEINISLSASDQPPELSIKILIIHYLLEAKGTPLTNKLIAFQEFQEGSVYYPSFIKRSIKPLIEYFGQTPEKLIGIAEEMGGLKSSLGDYSVTIPAFPRLPLTYVIWKGDEEFPPNANILFDASVLDYLPVEDITVLCQTITVRLVKTLQLKV
jgi:hypothetical protein